MDCEPLQTVKNYLGWSGASAVLYLFHVVSNCIQDVINENDSQLLFTLGCSSHLYMSARYNFPISLNTKESKFAIRGH